LLINIINLANYAHFLVYNGAKKLFYTYIKNFLSVTLNVLMSDYFTSTTVEGAQFCYYKTYTEHDSNQPSIQKQRSVWCTGTSVQANISCLDPFRCGFQKTCNKKK